MTRRVIVWDLGIRANWYRANTLVTISVTPSATVVVHLIEEETEQHWELSFSPYQAVRITTEECIWPARILDGTPQKGGFFEVLDSDWIDFLGKGSIHFLEKSRHFIVSTYDEAIEVIAWDYSVKKLGKGHS